MKRNAIKDLAKWKADIDRKPMVLRGARQVGKTWLMKEFAKALSLADEVVMVKIYPARESDTLGVSSGDIADLINKSGKSHAIYLETFEEIYNYLKEHNKPGDLCITMGAGDVYKIGEMLLKK